MRRFGLRLASLGIVATWGVLVCLLGPEDPLLAIVPALVLVTPLLWGRYPGEALLERIGAWLAGSLSVSWPESPGPLRCPRAGVPRGASLIAFSLSSRGPPVWP